MSRSLDAPVAAAKTGKTVNKSDGDLGLELRLVCACIIWPLDEARRAAIRRLGASGNLRWPLVEILVRRHRVSAMVGHALVEAGANIPSDQLEYFRKAGRDTAFHELNALFETKRVIAALEEEKIEPVLLKGIAVSARAFGRLGLRQSRDVDILVERSSVERASRRLESLGYKRKEPRPEATKGEVASWYRLHKDVVYLDLATGFLIELHWRLFDNPHLLPVPSFGADTIEVAPGQSFRVLQSLFESIYLCVHGAQHAWSRLKWLADIAAIVGRMSADELDTLMGEAVRLKVHAAVGQALLLCNRLLDVRINGALLETLQASRRLERLYQIAYLSIASGNGSELEEQYFGSTRKSMSHYLIKSGMRYWLSEVKFDLMDTSGIQMPSALRHFGPFSRILAWGWKRISLASSSR